MALIFYSCICWLGLLLILPFTISVQFTGSITGSLPHSSRISIDKDFCPRSMANLHLVIALLLLASIENFKTWRQNKQQVIFTHWLFLPKRIFQVTSYVPVDNNFLSQFAFVFILSLLSYSVTGRLYTKSSAGCWRWAFYYGGVLYTGNVGAFCNKTWRNLCN